MSLSNPTSGQPPPTQQRVEATIRFAGDAGDGMHLVGSLFAAASSQLGNFVGTLPDFPAEIRAIAGTLPNVAGYQVHFSSTEHHTPGDQPDTLVAMNPASLRANLDDLIDGGALIVNSDAFTADNLQKAGYTSNPLADHSLHAYRLLAVPLNRLNHEAVSRVNVSGREAERCRGFFALGLACWLYDRPLEPIVGWIRETYVKNPAMIEGAARSLRSAYQHGEAHTGQIKVPRSTFAPGRYRSISGAEALAAGLFALPRQTARPLVFACFPLPPANELLHRMCEHTLPEVTVVQAEDDLASLQMVIGAAFGGAIGVAASTGIGLALQADALGLAVMSELPCVVIDIQRAGPSLGMPSKTEQADLLQALYGRQGECPLIVLAPATPGDCFAMVHEAVRLAVRYMSPVVLLADTYLAHSAETWRVPDVADLPTIEVRTAQNAGPAYARDDYRARPWPIPGTPGLEHRTGGMEKEAETGNVSFDPANHEAMVRARARKIAGAAECIPPLIVEGDLQAELLVLGWGGTYGCIQAAVQRCRLKGLSVAQAHLRHLQPMPANVREVLGRHRIILVPELNSGQLCQVLRAAFLVEPVSMSKVQGRMFLVREIERKIEELLANRNDVR